MSATARPPVPAAGATWSDAVIPGDPAVSARVFRPLPGRGAPTGFLVWAHGGSWQYGSVAQWHDVTARIAALSGWTVVSVDYRLAPRHRHPAPLEDLLTALEWTRLRSDASGSLLAVGGDSSGATLAACAALAVRDRGGRLDAQVLAYPPLDPGFRAPGHRCDSRAFPTAAALRRAWSAHRGTAPTALAADGTVLHSTPLDAADHHGLAQAVLATGGLDPVSGDTLRYARILRDSRVPVHLHHPPGTGHADLLRPAGQLLPLLARTVRELPPDPRTPDDGNDIR
ncbi:alpha/beta hydrolase [Streptomyces sp. NRRL F-5123]|uniref:alpha/beta hydrolase n=1 Tax=Streptomyces sp. NRRL F-5123 TaxID=1463856 RepID=UPI000694035E|nr:alpha/beta hydrolase [Streptomyces sp. NRRL F-5123]